MQYKRTINTVILVCSHRSYTTVIKKALKYFMIIKNTSAGFLEMTKKMKIMQNKIQKQKDRICNNIIIIYTKPCLITYSGSSTYLSVYDIKYNYKKKVIKTVLSPFLPFIIIVLLNIFILNAYDVMFNNGNKL